VRVNLTTLIRLKFGVNYTIFSLLNFKL